MRLLLCICIMFQLITVNAQSYEDSILVFQEHLNQEYSNPEKSPLSKKELKRFKSHTYFPIDERFKVEATFERKLNAIPFLMKTTTSRLPKYEVYGVATFQIDDQTFNLNIYQSHNLREKEEFKNHLFLPFTDQTNGKSSYGGGRFIDLEIPEGDVIIIDFNKAYNPYCAYNENYSCPITPKENDVQIEIKAGVKL